MTIQYSIVIPLVSFIETFYLLSLGDKNGKHVFFVYAMMIKYISLMVVMVEMGVFVGKCNEFLKISKVSEKMIFVFGFLVSKVV